MQAEDRRKADITKDIIEKKVKPARRRELV
jgi:hypothetical protein